MPNQDRTGPLGQGPRTGGGFGACRGGGRGFGGCRRAGQGPDQPGLRDEDSGRIQALEREIAELRKQLDAKNT